MPHNIHLSNSADQEIECVVMPNGDWVLADVLTSAAMITFSGVGITKTTSEVIRLYRTAAMGAWSVDLAKSVSKFFEENAIKIPQGESKQIYSTTMKNPFQYFSISKWASLFKGANMTLMIRTKDGKYMCTFHTNDNYSWITQSDDMGYSTVRAKYGSLWQPDPKKGKYNFNEVKIELENSALIAGSDTVGFSRWIQRCRCQLNRLQNGRKHRTRFLTEKALCDRGPVKPGQKEIVDGGVHDRTHFFY